MLGDQDIKEQLPDLYSNPDYRTAEKTTTDLPEEQKIDTKAIMAEYEAMMADGEESPDSEQQASSENRLSANESDDRKLIQEMISTMRELTEEVKQLRSQIEVKPYDPAHYSSERPPGLATASEDSSAPATQQDAQSEQKKPAKKNKALSIISSVLFYAVLVAMVLGAFLMRSTSKGSPFVFAGFSAANVLTSSMEDVYPKGSLIVTKSVDAKELKVGDDITYMISETSSITHRIIGITENYQGTGERAFETKGTMNKNPDKEMVAAVNVVGKVVFHSKALGDFANFVRTNWPFLLFVIVVVGGLITFLKWNAKKSDSDEEEQEHKHKKKKQNKRKEKNR